jgi:magnesium transporter
MEIVDNPPRPSHPQAQHGAGRAALKVIPDLDEPIIKYTRHDFDPLNQGQTVAAALEQVRAKPPTGRVLYFYVVDDDDRLVGVVPTRLMLLSPPDANLESIMIRHVVTVPYTATVMHACELFTIHRFLAMPVVDEQRHFLGIVDIELYTAEVGDLARRTGFEDLFQLVGVHLAEAQMGNAANAFRRRFPWLLCNIVGGILAAFLTGYYQDVLDRTIVLALFIPIVLTVAESVSIQSISLVVLAMHGDDLRWGTTLAAIRRESATGVLLGLASGPIVGLVAWLWKGQGAVALSILAAITLAVASAALIGAVVPIGLRLLRRDPRVAAGPITLVIADLATLLIYFNLARWLLA